jgi:hypothetical protein
LASFTRYRNKEEERVAFLDSQLETVQFLNVYSHFTLKPEEYSEQADEESVTDSTTR